ncbi:MAG: hypothetical protein AAF546_08445 [Verrucomicrobiota bacterium]
MNHFTAQFIKDGRLILRELVVWAFATALSTILITPWVGSWAGNQLSNIDSVQRFLGTAATFIILGVIVTNWLIAHRLIAADNPVNPKAFWLSRPVGPHVLAASKFAWILSLAWVVPLFSSLPILLLSGTTKGALQCYLGMGVLFTALGAIPLAGFSLVRKARFLFYAIIGIFVIQLAGQIYFRIGSGPNLPSYSPVNVEQARKVVGLSLTVVGVFALIYIQYRKRNFWIGILSILSISGMVWTMTNKWSLALYSDSIDFPVPTEKFAIDSGRLRASSGTSNKVPYFQIESTMPIIEIEPGLVAKAHGVESELIGTLGRTARSFKVGQSLSNEIADTFELTRVSLRGTEAQPHGASITLARENTADWDQQIGQIQRIEGTIHYRLYRIHEPLRSRNNLVRHKDDWVWSKMEAIQPSGLNVKTFSITTEDRTEKDGLLFDDRLLVNPDQNEWLDKSGRNSRSSSLSFLRNMRTESNDFQPETRSMNVDGNRKSVLAPEKVWFEQAELWLPVVENLGSYRQDFSIDLSENQNGRWLIFPTVQSDRDDGSITSFNISLIDIVGGKTTTLGGGIDKAYGQWNTLWLDGNSLLMGTSKGVFKVTINPADSTIRRIKPSIEEVKMMLQAMAQFENSGFIPREFLRSRM